MTAWVFSMASSTEERIAEDSGNLVLLGEGRVRNSY